ncbi:ER membrane protein complex subunit 1-like [Clavelina lepadiformis]|uniref:ER membrane protein complex subunit 1-like n=1 Tax=Clavelina lepadiformis TaxID=159417 RepID=UPI004042CB38
MQYNIVFTVKFVAVFGAFLCSFGDALYEDQIGKFDWKKELLGRVEHAVFDSSVSLNKHGFVTTEKGAIACINMRTGEVKWRRILPESDRQITYLAHVRDGLVVVSTKGMARLWDSASGILKWEVDLSVAAENRESFTVIHAATLERSYSEKTLLVILSKTGLHTIAISLTKRKPEIQSVLLNQELTDGDHDKIFVDSQNGKIIHLQLQSGVRLEVTVYDADNLSSPKQVTISTSWLDSLAMTALLEDDTLLYVSNDVGAIHLVDLENGNTQATVPLLRLGIKDPVTMMSSNEEEDVAVHGSDVILSHGEGQMSLIKITGSTVKLMQTKIIPEVSDVVFKQKGTEVYAYFASQINNVVSIVTVNVKTGKYNNDLTINVTLPPHTGTLEKVYVNMFLKRNTPVGFRALLQTTDETVFLVTQPNRIAWQRQEAIASVVHATMLDLPLSDVDAGIEAEFEESGKTKLMEMFFKRVSAQGSQLISWFNKILRDLKEDTLFTHKTRDPLIQVEGLTRDPFSLHKMIVLVTKSGVLFGMDSLTGEIVWRYFLSQLKGRQLHFFVQRTTAHYPHPPQALLLGLDSSQSQPPIVLAVNPITGVVIDLSADFINLESPVIQAMPFPVPDNHHLRPLIMLDADLNIHLVPDTSDIRAILGELNLFMYDVNVSNGLIRGFSLSEKNSAQLIWSMHLPNTHKIIKFSGKPALEKVDSMGRPLADRSVIYKYLNPNVIAILSESFDDAVDRSSLLLYVIDAVTGAVIHSAIHKKASGPVHMVHSENWLIYSYWNAKARRNEIASFEFYEGKKQFNATVFSSFQTRPDPIVMQQAYIFSAGISCIGVSQTDKGITSRQILFGLKKGVLFGLPRRFFDPRRPLHATERHREEGLVQYMPEIPIPPELYLSYNLTVEGMERIYTAPAALESTSLVLATGLDLFFTRTQPSKMFDVLKEDFDHLLIAVVLLGMFAAALITRRMAQVKQLNKAWR